MLGQQCPPGHSEAQLKNGELFFYTSLQLLSFPPLVHFERERGHG